MKLYSYWRSSSAWRVRIALHLKQLPFTYEAVHLVEGGGQQFQPAHRARNPMSQVPVLEWDEGGQTRRLAQSMAIIEYLDEVNPAPPLLPREPFRRAQARMLAEHFNSGIQPYHNAIVLKRIRELLPGTEQADVKWASEWVARFLVGVEAAMKPLAGTYAMGEQISLPDLYLVPQLYAARRFKVDLAPFPTLTRIDAALAQHPAFIAAHPDQQPDAPPMEKR